MKGFKSNVIILLSIVLALIITACAPSNISGPSSDSNQTASPEATPSQSVTEGQPFVFEEKHIEIPSLKDVFSEYWDFGVGMDYNDLDRYDELLVKHVNGITPGNSTKPESTQPVEGKFTFDNGDKIVNFGLDNNMDIHGHTLVWHSQTPSWFFKDSGGNSVSRDVALERMKNHIFTVMNHYKGKIKEWDVVNEPISDDDSSLLRADSPWYKAIGEDYVKMAFIYAHEADPDAKLFINDFNVEVPGKRERYYKLIKELLDEGVPVHGIGFQGHWQLGWPSYQDIRETLKMFSELGLEIQITELDISMYDWGTSVVYPEPTPDLLKRQADRYQTLFEIFKEFNGSITKVSTWGIADDGTWLDNFPVPNRKNWPLLFDMNHEPKESFWRIVNEPVLSGIVVESGTLLKPFVSGTLTHLLRVDSDVEEIKIKPIANDIKVDIKVENAEKSGDAYIVKVNQDAPQVKIIVSGYGKTNTYELYLKKNTQEKVAGWEFNEGQGVSTKDSTGYTRDADIGSLAWVDGIEGKALKFEGNGQYLDLGLGESNLFGSNDFSVSFWIKPDQIKKGAAVLWYGQPVTMDSLLWRASLKDNGSVHFQLQRPIDKETFKGSQFVSTGDGVIEAGEWSNIICIRKGETLQIYVNGEKAAEDVFDYTVDISGFTEPLMAGKDKDNKGNDFVGELDSIRIFNYALSAEDVTALFNEMK